MKIIALIVAAGTGSRYRANIPKQYLPEDKPILRQTIKRFIESKVCDGIQVIIRKEDVGLYEEAVVGLDLLPVCFGDKDRFGSVKKGINNIAKYNPNMVLVHDASRPFVSTNLIKEIVKNLKENPEHAVVPACQISDTVKRISEKGTEIINRDNLFSIQTPQGYYFKDLSEKCLSSKISFTDESSLMDNNGYNIIYIPGEKENIKITFQDDISSIVKIAKEIVSLESISTITKQASQNAHSFETRTGIGFDAHRFGNEESNENQITLGGIKIPFNKILLAHSDGDVLFHALVDAILGAIGAGDIGMHFSNKDPKWKNADSKLFLLYCKKLLEQRKAQISNIDITVLCEQPQISIYSTQIKNNIANILSINFERVNIKACTTEKMGFLGRQEGIAVQAICTVIL